MTDNKKQRGNIFWGVLAGSVLGALGGVFLVPKSGKDLRFVVKDKGRKVFYDVKEIYSDALTKAREIFEKTKHRVQEF